MIRIEGLSKSFGGKPVLQNLSLEIAEGERFVLLGRSGCGKTTLLRCIAGFEQPDAGTISIQGRVVNSLPVERRPVGFIFQRHALFPHKTVYDNIAVGPRIRGEAEADIRDKIDALLTITRLSALRHAWPGQLSGGESQRVALARAVINRPQVLLLDEPLSALDATLRQNLRDELVEMQKAFGITFLFVTHDQEEAMSLADRMGVLEDGRLLQVGEPERLYDRPANRFVAEFLGGVNRLPGVVESAMENGCTVRLDGGGEVMTVADGRKLKSGALVDVFFRPEKAVLCSSPNYESGRNLLEGVLERKSFFGSHTRYRVALKNGSAVTVQVRHGNDAGLRSGMAVWVQVAAEDTLIYEREQNEAASA
ncbi:ABC transporter ATP-binding protein [Nitrospina gracilis]|uniref:ABC transporter ATP-binding protein n=1 Tax=Nitrospina gracilis TaxID=35801 RepID=UPI001F3D00E8|nr:ABC transporter ATP-binding protein [Nitrospina gracilis]MCF8719448.1 ABC-type Fe3+/spermidine/putrescine transport system ATPase subunit [Nitrospina gracilis Nb-211]